MKPPVATMIGLPPIFSYLTEMMQRLGKIPQNPVTRFAPSPTGVLHVGHVASAIFVWGIGRRAGAHVLLRIEDHDAARSRPQHELAIFADLAWLGLAADNAGQLRFAEASDFRQSDNTTHYLAGVAELQKQHHVYGCDCTRQQIAKDMDAMRPGETLLEQWYSGRCRHRGLSLDAPGVGWRVQLPDVEQVFADLLLGPQRQYPARQCGDLLLRDRHGLFTYNYAVVVDDLRHGVNLIIRGQDLTSATGRQLWLRQALGGSSAVHFLHHPLITDEHGQKLSKRFLAEGLAVRRTRGETPEQVLGLAAQLAGLQPQATPQSVSDLERLFDLKRTD